MLDHVKADAAFAEVGAEGDEVKDGSAMLLSKSDRSLVLRSIGIDGCNDNWSAAMSIVVTNPVGVDPSEVSAFLELFDPGTLGDVERQQVVGNAVAIVDAGSARAMRAERSAGPCATRSPGNG